MISEMANVAAECVKNPTKPSVWVAELGQYVCPESTDGQRALAEARRIVLRRHRRCRKDRRASIHSSNLCS